MSKKSIGIGAVVAIIVVGALFAIRPEDTGGFVPVAEARSVTVYRSPTCGCCANYISYLKRSGFEVESVTTQNMEEIKTRYGVPQHELSCHTTVAGEYVIEGHVPVEVIGELFARKPTIRGIALPGMPMGSPGMAGTKVGPFAIDQFTEDGITERFLAW